MPVYTMAGDDNGKAISPASVPSLAETSYASSHEDGGDDDHNIVRSLFGRNVPKEIVENIDKISDYRAEGREDHDIDKISVTSSETTAIAGPNLSLKSVLANSSSNANNNVPGSFPSIFVPDPNEEEDDDEDVAIPPPPATKPSRIVYEEPPQENTSCNHALSRTPKQLADMLLAFEGAQRIWPPKHHQTSGSTEPDDGDSIGQSSTDTVASPLRTDGWMPRAESLDRECKALKKIIREDSSKLLNLRSAMEAQRDLNNLKEMELEERRIELQIADVRLLAVKREREEFREREAELLETIQILKSEVDSLTRYKSTMEALKEETEQFLDEDENEMKHMRESIKTISTQVSEQGITIAELRKTIQSKEEENSQLRKDLAALQKGQQTGVSPSLVQDMASTPNGHLAEMLLNISKRLEAVETEKGHSGKSLSLESKQGQVEEKPPLESKQKKDEIEDIQLPGVDCDYNSTEGQSTDECIKISEDPDEIEVSAPPKGEISVPQKKEARGTENVEDSKGDWCCAQTDCDVWSAISGDAE